MDLYGMIFKTAHKKPIINALEHQIGVDGKI
jgi:hypothetical protein